MLTAMALLATGETRAEPCAPTAVVSGEPQLVGEVEQRLISRGVATTAGNGCPFVRAEVAYLGAEILASIEDGDGRRSERVIASTDVAASLIESWTRFDIAGDLMGPPLGYDDGAGESTAELPPSTATSQVVFEEQVEPTGENVWSGWLALAPEVTAGTNRSTLFGARASLCGRVGPACIGALVRFGYDPGLTGNSEALETRRMALDGLVIFDFPLEWSRVSLVPGIGVGGGWSRSSRLIVDEDDDEQQEGEHEDRYDVTGDIAEDDGGFRFDAHATLAFALTRDLSLDISLAVGVSALGHYGAYPYDDGDIAGEPRATLRGGVGLGYRF